MKILLSWLNEFVDTDRRSPEDIGRDLESLGHEVEGVHPLNLDGVIVGKVQSVQAHPNADRLRVAEVDLGSRIETIVCGAPNLDKGQKVAVATVGTRLPGGMVIEERTIRGVISRGMICAQDELGLGTDHAGILVLDESRVVGEPFLKNPDTLFDLAITPNRGDALSLNGLARDLAARWEQPTLSQSVDPVVEGLSSRPVVGSIGHGSAIRYSARYLEFNPAEDCPTTVKERLGLVGHGTYHPIVDLTNYVMEEFGVPLHAFDADKLHEPLEVRHARSGETIMLLNGQTYPLEDWDIIIADQSGPIALAGIMGGYATRVTESTARIVLEAAWFPPDTIRRTRTRLGITSDAAYRFERGTDPGSIETASGRFAQLAIDHLDAVVGPVQFIGSRERYSAQYIGFEPTFVNQRLGTDFSEEQIIELLERLGFCLTKFDPSMIKTDQDRYIFGENVTGYLIDSPSWRSTDSNFPHDFVEEVARLVGYDTLPRVSLPLATGLQPLSDHVRFTRLEHLKNQLSDLGWTEHIGSSFLSPTEATYATIDHDALIALANPVSEEATFLRPTLLVSLLKALAKNPIFDPLALFEIGTVFTIDGENTRLGLVWTDQQQSFPYDLGATQLVPQQQLNHFKVRRAVYYWEGPIETLISTSDTQVSPHRELASEIRELRMPSRYQPVLRDISIVVPRVHAPETLRTMMKTLPLVVDVELFDQYEGEKLGDNWSLAFHILLEHPERTLTNQEIQETMEQVETQLKEQFNATIR